MVLAVLAIAVFVFIADHAMCNRTSCASSPRCRAAWAARIEHDARRLEGELTRLFAFSPRNLEITGVVLTAYAALEGMEAVGLWRARRWADT